MCDIFGSQSSSGGGVFKFEVWVSKAKRFSNRRIRSPIRIGYICIAKPSFRFSGMIDVATEYRAEQPYLTTQHKSSDVTASMKPHHDSGFTAASALQAPKLHAASQPLLASSSQRTLAHFLTFSFCTWCAPKIGFLAPNTENSPASTCNDADRQTPPLPVVWAFEVIRYY